MNPKIKLLSRHINGEKNHKLLCLLCNPIFVLRNNVIGKNTQVIVELSQFIFISPFGHTTIMRACNHSLAFKLPGYL